ncbi:MAG: hypothetical protein M1514_01725 [Patescibacteria group bacterium]|nr:hypothetical protein [Patescibacteria group bacterium]
MFTLSKKNSHKVYLGVGIFIFAFITFALGFKLGKQNEVAPKETLSSTGLQATPEEDENLIFRCGDISDAVMETGNFHWAVMTGPEWSPDCRYIAWGIWMTGTGVPDEVMIEPQKLDPSEGIYLYSDANHKITKIFNPKEVNSTPIFVKWGDRFTIEYKVNEKNYVYDLTSKSTQTVDNQQ